MIPKAHFFSPQGPDKVAVLWAEPASEGESLWLLRTGQGPRSGQLTKGSVFGPFSGQQLLDEAAKVLRAIEEAGFFPSGRAELIEALSSKNPAVRGRSALRLGWRRATDAVPALLAAGAQAKGDLCPIVDALGWIGDPQAIPFVREIAERKLLSRRRSAVEALRNLGDTEGLALARQRAQDRLPAAINEALSGADEKTVTQQSLDALMDAAKEIQKKKWGLLADTLYEAASPLAVAFARRLLAAQPVFLPHLWRYTKSILKRAMLRHDAKTLGYLAHEVDSASARGNTGITAVVKSGYDGKKRQVRVFAKKTQLYVRRALWRYMRDLARWRPQLYTETAAEVLVHYGPKDHLAAKGKVGTLGRAYLLGRVLWNESDRLALDDRALVFRYRSQGSVTVPKGVREEAFADLWDSYPRPLLRLLASARLDDVTAFALSGLERHPEIIRHAKIRELLALLERTEPLPQKLALRECARRFNPLEPNWKLLEAILAHRLPAARELSYQWLELAAPQWTRSVERSVALLSTVHPQSRKEVAKVCVAHLADAGTFRQSLATAILDTLTKDEPEPGAFSALVAVALEGLQQELDQLLSLDDLLGLLGGGQPQARALAGPLLAEKPGALSRLGMEGSVALGNDELAAVRRAAHALLRASKKALAEDPSPLFALAESPWQDTQSAAFDLLCEMDARVLGLDGLVSLCDSTVVAVQDVGKRLVRESFESLDAETLLFRLAEHPHANMRAFALELITEHLRAGYVPLARIEGFFRACLLEVFPARAVKDHVLELLLARGLCDERQAELVAGILGDVVRTKTRTDFDKILTALTKIQLAFPNVASPLSLQGGAS